MSSSTLLLKGGHVVTFKNGSSEPHVSVADMLIRDDKITEISTNISAPAGVNVIDASQYIVSPGFIDTHRHMWQGAMKTLTADCTLQEYMFKFLWTNHIRQLTVDDAYIGQLAGGLEAIWSGVTTVVDHCHITHSEKQMDRLVAGSVDAGLRTHFCYTRGTLPTSVNPFEFGDEAEAPKWQIPQIERLAAPGGIPNNTDNRVQIGLAYDAAPFAPPEVALEVVSKFRAAAPGGLITVHAGRSPNLGFHEVISHWAKHGLLQNDVLFSHANGLTDEDWNIIKKADASIGSTPEDELAMSMGHPTVFEAKRRGIRAGIGMDAVSAVSGDLFAAMRFALQSERARRNAELAKQGRIPHHLRELASDVFRMATLGGAEAIHREHELGTLEVGKKADIILVRRDSPSTAGYHDPIQALVLNTNVGDVHMVIINGEILKRDGNFVRHDWPAIAKKLEESRKRIHDNRDSSQVLQTQHDACTTHLTFE